MTDKFKKRVREHAVKHNMSYQAALQQLSQGETTAPTVVEILQERCEEHRKEGKSTDTLEALLALHEQGKLEDKIVLDLLGLSQSAQQQSDPKVPGNEVLLPIPSDTKWSEKILHLSTLLENPEREAEGIRELMRELTWVKTQEIRTRHRRLRAVRADAMTDTELEELAKRLSILCERRELLELAYDGLKTEITRKNGSGSIDPEILRALGWARVREPAMAWKLPPPQDDTATEFPDEAFHAWVEYARKLEEEVEQRNVQLAGCSVAAFGHAKGNNDAKAGAYGHSVAFDDVKNLRLKYERALGLIGALWKLLDDIDTAGDIAKSDDKVFRSLVGRHQKKRWETGVISDGYRVYLRDWPAKRKPEEWMDMYDPTHAKWGPDVLDEVGPEIFAESAEEDPRYIPPWNCSECGPVSRCDEDGCCLMCGTDLFYDEDGNPLPVPEANAPAD